MTTEIKNDYDLHRAIDRLILRSLGEKLENQLDRAWRDIEYVHDELQALAAAEELPEAYRESVRLVTHELRHVHQYETAGSIAAFLPVYLQQILDYGYAHAPLEMDARAHEQVGASDIPAE